MRKKLMSLPVLLLICLSFSYAVAYEILNGPTQLIQYKASKAYEGYTLITAMNTDKTYLIDMLGYVVHTWDHKTKPPGLHFVLLKNGHLLGNSGTGVLQGPPGEDAQGPPEGGAGMMEGPPPGDGAQGPPGSGNGPGQPGSSGKMSFGGGAKGLIELDWDGNVVWEFEPGPSQGALHHDFLRLPNGNTLCNAWEAVSYEEAITGGRRADQTTKRGVGTDVIYEIDPKGHIVWKWSAWEHRGMNSKAHLDVNYITYVLPEHEQNNPDWTHFNTVDYDLATDRILVDSREFGELYIIDHKTGAIVYRWGNPSAYGAGAAPTLTTPGEQILFGPHDAHWIKKGLPGAGHILIFNNGWARPPVNYSSVIEMDPDTGKIVWEYKAGSGNSFYSHHISNAERLPNGNTLICSGNSGHLFEVTAKKEVVWEYINPVVGKKTTNWVVDGSMEKSNGMFRVHRYGLDYPGLQGRELKPQGQIEADIKGGWIPKVDLEGATQPGAGLWKALWK
jgi:outer membrane protein assembly factor BamB